MPRTCCAGTTTRDALVFRGEDKVKRRMSWAELNEAVARLSRAFAAAGVTAGDRVCAIVPNMPEAIVAFLAASSLGAIWSSCSPDFGERGILDRFGQIEPKILITCDGYYYAGKTIRMAEKVGNVLKAAAERRARAGHRLHRRGRTQVAEALPKRRDAVALRERPRATRRSAFAQLPLRASALHPLFVGHDRHSEMHRASARAASC